MRQSILAALLWLNVTYSVASEPLPVPERGFVSSQPARTWEEGLICGNGTIGANALSHPLKERIIFSHERLFLPMGPPVMPPDQSARLFEIRRLIERGLYKQACQLQFDLSGQEGFMYPDYFVPAFDLAVHTQAKGEVRDYARSVNFQTGETVVHWADDRGVFERRMFVSRAAGVAVLLLTGTSRCTRLPSQTRAPGTEPRVQFGLRRQQAFRPGFSGAYFRHQEHRRRLGADLHESIHQSVPGQHSRVGKFRAGCDRRRRASRRMTARSSLRPQTASCCWSTFACSMIRPSRRWRT